MSWIRRPVQQSNRVSTASLLNITCLQVPKSPIFQICIPNVKAIVWPWSSPNSFTLTTSKQSVSLAKMSDPQALNWTLINQMADALTPDQRDAAEWRIAHTGKIQMQDYKVSKSLPLFWTHRPLDGHSR